MSLARGQIEAARPIILRRSLDAHFNLPGANGGSDSLALRSVPLEPPVGGHASDGSNAAGTWSDLRQMAGPWRRLRIWISPNEHCRWELAEHFPRQLAHLSSPVSFEVMGNSRNIMLMVGCHEIDLDSVRMVFESTYQHSKVTLLDLNYSVLPPADNRDDIHFRDFFPPSSFFERFTCPDQLAASPLLTLFYTLDQVPPDGFGLYQVIFQPVRPENNWHNKVGVALDTQYLQSLTTNPIQAIRGVLHTPAGDERVMANDLETKADNASSRGLPPCAIRILREGVAENQRVICFRLAVHMYRLGFPEELALPMLRAWSKRNRPVNGKRIITNEEIIQQVRCAYDGEYRGYGCSDPIIARYCSEPCPLHRTSSFEAS